MVKRYQIECSTETTTRHTASAGGEWVRYEDYQSLEESYTVIQGVMKDIEKRYAEALDQIESLRDELDTYDEDQDLR